MTCNVLSSSIFPLVYLIVVHLLYLIILHFYPHLLFLIVLYFCYVGHLKKKKKGFLFAKFSMLKLVRMSQFRAETRFMLLTSECRKPCVISHC